MTMLGDADRATVRKYLGVMTQPVKVLLFNQTFDAPESALVARQILSEVAELNPLISIEEVNFILERERAAQYGVEGVPALVLLRGDADTRIRFLGAPSGYEFMSLVEAIILAGTDKVELSDGNLALLANVSQPTDIKVFVTPTCPHCPRAVTLAHKMALAQPLVTATCVEATEFLDLSRRYRVTGVPKTVVNNTIEIMGALPEDDFVRAVLQVPAEDERASASD